MKVVIIPMLLLLAHILVACEDSDDPTPGLTMESPSAVSSQEPLNPSVSTIAGVPGQRGFVDGSVLDARFSSPSFVVVNGDGTILVSDSANHAIRKIDQYGQVTTLAGTGEPGAQDGPASKATFNSPAGLAVDERGNVYVADSLNHKIRLITLAGNVSTIAGGGPPGLGGGGYRDGPAEGALFRFPKGLALSDDGSIFIADSDNQRIRKLQSGIVTTFAGTGSSGSLDGPAALATFTNVSSLAFGDDDTLYVADQPASVIRAISNSGMVHTIQIETTLTHPAGILFESESGLLFIADTGGQRIVGIDPASGSVRFEAGSGAQGHKDGALDKAEFANPSSIAVDYHGHRLLVADPFSRTIRSIEDWR